MDTKLFSKNSPGKLVKIPAGYWAFIPNRLPPRMEYSPRLVTALAGAERSLGELRGVSDGLADPNLLLRPFILMEAVLSSRIEGTRASLEDLLIFEGTQLALFEENRDVREVQNYVNALEYGLERMKDLPVSLRLIKEIHAQLMEGVRGEGLRPGEFRTKQNWIGTAGATLEDATYVPPPPEEMKKTLGELERFLNQASEIPALIKLGMAHYQLEAIHPFADGNGRMGRLLIALMMSAWELLPRTVLNLSAAFEAERQRYYARLLAVSQCGEWEEWLVYFLDGIKQESRRSIQRIKALEGLRDRYMEVVRKERADERLSQAVNALFFSPILTVRQMEKQLGTSYLAAERCIQRLIELRILREITGKARNRIYQADEILKALNE